MAEEITWDLDKAVDQLRQAMLDQGLSDEEQARVLNAAGGEGARILRERKVAETAHLHDVDHVVKVKRTKQHGPHGEVLEDDLEDNDTSDFICHDCGRGLESDVGSERILVCPRVHGIRPETLRPKKVHGAVECGIQDRAA